MNRHNALGLGAILQGTVEGGFMGRTNKLVDGCYSYWQGALLPLLQQLGPELLSQSSLPRTPKGMSGGSLKEDELIPSGPIIVPSFPSRRPVGIMQQAEDAVVRSQV